MKNIRLLLTVSLMALIANFSITTARAADSNEMLFVSKASDSLARLSLDSKTYIVPIHFADGASWDSVKHAYNVPSGVADLIEHGKVVITVNTDGVASFSKKK